MQTSGVTTRAIQLPIIDVSRMTTETAKEVVHAATTYGFLYVQPAGTGLTPSIVDRQFTLSKEFFARPSTEKAVYHIDTTNRGWGGISNENLDPTGGRRSDFKEVFNFGEFDNNGHLDQNLPPTLELATDDIRTFQSLCEKICHRIVDLIGMGLEVEESSFFSNRHTKPSASTMRYLYYPALPEDDEWDDTIDVRAGAHSDYGSLTLLFQRVGQPGLEIRTAADDSWAPVAVVPEGYDHDSNGMPPIVVNVADLMTYWTNGLLKSTVHRVIFPKGGRQGEDRYSMVFFCHPGNDTELVPVPSQIVRAKGEMADGTQVGYGGGSATRRAMTAREHFLNRIQATYSHRKEVAQST